MDNTPRFLITTAHECTWRFDGPVVFLGAWCCLEERRAAWEKPDALIAPYHWDDRDRLYRDIEYLRQLYEVLLVELSEALNAYHGIENSTRYWRILVGPWLQYFTQILFDRWTSIQDTVRGYQLSGTAILDIPPHRLIPNDMAEFRDWYHDDPWNHAIYGTILQRWTGVHSDRVAVSERKSAFAVQGARRTVKRAIKDIAAKGVSTLSGLLVRDRDAFLISTYLPPKQKFLLQLALGQLPSVFLPVPAPRIAPNLEHRRRLNLRADRHAGFEKCIRTLIQEQIPIAYVEGYPTLRTAAAKLPWPKSPRVVFTATSYNSDETFKTWAASKVEAGSSLVIGQHGGNLGSALCSSSEEHELKIADRYITWGWSDGNSKQVPVGSLKLLGRGPGTWRPDGKLLLVTSVMPRYSYVLGSYPIATSQTQAYLEGLYKFVRLLDDDLRRSLLVRLFLPDWGWSQTKKWRAAFPDVRIDTGKRPIEALIKDSRLYVATYNATTFLESLGRNIPTIIFWNPKHFELRPEARPYFERLKKVGIFHESAEEAAAKVKELWSDVGGWWTNAQVQEARRVFCDRFARVPDRSIDALRQALSTAHSQHH